MFSVLLCYGWVRVFGPEGAVISIHQSSLVNQNGDALVHNPFNVGLGVAVELENFSVQLFFSLLSLKAGFEVHNVKFDGGDVSSVLESVPCVAVDVGQVVLDFSVIFCDFSLGAVDSLLESDEEETDGLNSNNLIRVDVDLVGVPSVVRELSVEVEAVDSGVEEISLWGDYAFLGDLGKYVR